MARRRKKLRGLQPLPEMLTADAWQVHEGMPSVNLPDRHMYVPLDDTPEAAYMRAHEMVHVKITPPMAVDEMARHYGVTPLALQCVEDMRVHDFMRQRKLDRPAVTSRKETDKNLERIAEQTRLISSLLISVKHCDAQREILSDAISDSERIDAETVWGVTLLVEECYKQKRAQLREAGLDAVASPDGFEKLTVPVAKLFDALFSGKADDEVSLAEYVRHCHRHTSTWGDLEPPFRASMTLSRKSKRGADRTWREEGTVPSAMYRLTLDNRVFARKRKDKGGTVLIDASGSMDFTTENLAAVIAAAPGAVIAAYAGQYDAGRLVIVAANGKMATPEAIQACLTLPGCDHPMYGNVVDGPALRWLAKQAGPRVWVSDGIVTGRSDAAGVNLIQEVNTICRQADIERILNWREVVEALR